MKLKYLLSSLLLVSFFGVVNATVYTGSIPGETLQDQYVGYYYTYKIDKDLNFITVYNDVEYPFLFYTYNGEGCGNGIRALQFFWNNGKIYTFGNFRDNTVFGQGYLKYMCKSDTTDFQQYCLADGTDSHYSSDINELYETTTYFNELYIDNLVSGDQNPSCYGGQLAVCFISDSTNTVYCIKKAIARGFTDNLTQGNLISQYGVLPNNYQNAMNNNIYGDSPLDITPSGGGGGSTVSPLDDNYTVGEVLSAYSELGYSTDLCRSHFAIDDLAVSGDMTQFYDWTLTTGASIFDLYNAYSGGVGFDTFMNSRYSRWYPSYTHETTLGFVGYPKGLWRIPYILYIRSDSISNLTYRNYYYYCYFALYGSYSGTGGDRNDIFNESMLGSGSLPVPVIDVLDHIDSIGEGVFPIEGSVFYNTGAFVPGGGAGGGGSDLEEEDPLCSELDDPVSQFKCFYNKVSNISFDLGDNPGILPRVIGLAFLLALLFYVFKR